MNRNYLQITRISEDVLLMGFKRVFSALVISVLFGIIFCFSALSAQELGGKIKEAKASIKTYDNGDVVIESAKIGFRGTCVTLMAEFLFYPNTWEDNILASFTEGYDEQKLNDFFKLKRCGSIEKIKFSPLNIIRSIDAGIPVPYYLVFKEELDKKIKENHKIERPKSSKKDEIDKYLKLSAIDYKQLKKSGAAHKHGLIIGYNKNTKELLCSMLWLNDYAWISYDTFEKSAGNAELKYLGLVKLNANYNKVYKELEPKASE